VFETALLEEPGELKEVVDSIRNGLIGRSLPALPVRLAIADSDHVRRVPRVDRDRLDPPVERLGPFTPLNSLSCNGVKLLPPSTPA
jgi:hypothetical protein